MYRKIDKAAHDDLYRDRISPLASAGGPEEYIQRYEMKNLVPFYQGGSTKGYVRGLVTKKLIEVSSSSGRAPNAITVLEAGCGQGELSVYLASKGFNVIGVDISPVACSNAIWLAERIGVTSRCIFYAEDLGKLTLAEKSVNYIIGHASLHHFIKYDSVPAEFARVLKSGGRGFFADSYGENKIYHLFHDKERMRCLGDVSLTKPLINNYFNEFFEVRLTPTDWFSMLDKLYLRILPSRWNGLIRRLSLLHYHIDRLIPISSRVALLLSGAVMTEIISRR